MRTLNGLVFLSLRLPNRSVLRQRLPDTDVFARLRQRSRTPSAKSAGFDRSENTFPRLENSWSVRRRAGQPRARFGKLPNRGNGESVLSPFRRFAVSPSPLPLSGSSVQI